MHDAQIAWKPPEEWAEWAAWLSAALHGRHRWRLPVVLVGMLFAHGRRTVSSWLRAAGVSDDYQDYYYFIAKVGQEAKRISSHLVMLLLKNLPLPERLVVVIDDTPTKRYGPRVEGASIHRNPTPGPADENFLYGHIWVTIALVIRHALWGAIALPLCALLYVRKEAMARLPEWRNWQFATKLQLAAQLLGWLAPIIHAAGKKLWLVVDGGYASRQLLDEARKLGVTVVGRLRKDAALCNLPPPGNAPKRGRPRKYGPKTIDLAKRAAQPRGWQQVDCLLYGKPATKTVKTFVATWKPARGPVRVVIVRETNRWIALFCTDIHAKVTDILEAYADRATVEQNFHDLKEVWGAGQQQLRNIWANIGAYHLNLWSYTLLEMWAWNRPHEELTDRSASPWDDPNRRPSHSDRRKALQRYILGNEFSRLLGARWASTKIGALLLRLAALAA
ncbi:MAG: hypothetical protein KatS3mg110_4436 [Pirellulaceae bacterium]|nr:MAG: hypothetical protein KatS3mg110_4436 [Pirellulaceae bacterium]